MSFKSILACASGGSASDGAIEVACRLARHFQSHLESFHVRADPREVLLAVAGSDMPINGEWIDRMNADAEELAAKTKSAFMDATKRQGIALDKETSGAASATWRQEIGNAPRLVSRRARFFDIVVLGRSDRVVEEPHSDTIEETLIHSGRPVLLAPTRAPATLGDVIAIGWNGSPEAVRVLSASLPLLGMAKRVFIITVGDKHEASAADLEKYLGWHCIASVRRHVGTVSGVGPGEALLAAARDEGADLLAMGGFGHAPWRELLFGGVTRDLVGTSLLPLLLSH
jgi:nucleotide-binding universal stress UspA family protein